MARFLISGYYGFNNFGDDAILKAITDFLKNETNNNITVISNNPESTKKYYQVNSIFKLDIFNIIKTLVNTDIFISGGGSLLQDKTSIKSLLYYLFIIFLAKTLNTKTIIFAQGIGPINSSFGKFITKIILKKVSIVSVRDKNSQKFLSQLGINSLLVTDPVWAIEKPNNENIKDEIQKVGIQLRSWKDINDSYLKNLAETLTNNFNIKNIEFILLSLQESHDLEIINKFSAILKEINSEVNLKIENNVSIDENLKSIEKLDFLFGMRFHACLVAIKFGIPTFALSYDPKVTTLAEDAKIPYIETSNYKTDELNDKVKSFIKNANSLKESMKKYSTKKEQQAKETMKLLIDNSPQSLL